MVDQKLIDLIKGGLGRAQSKDQIYKELLNAGHSLEDIEQAFVMATHKEDKGESQRRIINIIVTVGAILVGAGIFSAIAANWRVIPAVIKILLIICLVLFVNLSGWYLKEQQQREKTGQALLLLGSIFFGAGIFLVAQIFNIRSMNWPDGFILWMIGSLGMAIAMNINLLYYLSIASGVVAIVGSPINFFIFLGEPELTQRFMWTASSLLIFAVIMTLFAALTIRKKILAAHQDYYK